MNRIIINSIVVIAVLFGCASAAQAQQYLISSTTLNGAITSTGANSFVLTSASATPSTATSGAPAAGQCLYVERELMQITAISSTRVTVIRGTGGTSAALHPTGAVVFTSACAAFRATDPVSTAGVGNGSLPSLKACTTATMGSRPFINVLNGNVWLCISSVWSATNAMVITYNSVNVF